MIRPALLTATNTNGGTAGMGPLSKEEREAFLEEPRIGVVSVARRRAAAAGGTDLDGYEPGGDLTFFTGTQGRKARKIELIRKAGAVSFVVQHDKFPYRYVTVEGPVISMDKPPTSEQMLKSFVATCPKSRPRASSRMNSGAPPKASSSSLPFARSDGSVLNLVGDG